MNIYERFSKLKLGILTYHRVVNDGSVVQAYCLHQIIRDCYPDAEVEIIDYRPMRGEINEYRRLVSRKCPFLRIAHWYKLRSVRTFIQSYCTLSPPCITDNLNQAKRFIRQQKYDSVFVGSDTVWEARNSAFAPSFPSLYFFPDLLIRKASFAASADPILPNYLQNQIRSAQILQAIRSFNFISIRDEPTRAYLIKLGIEPERLHFMPDPTLLWDFSSIVEQPFMRQKIKKIAGISINISDYEIKMQIEHQLRKAGYETVYLTDAVQVKQLLGVQSQTVGQRVGLYGILDLLVTDRFHGSIFTLKQAQIPVIFVETAQKWPESNSKGRDLFQRLGIQAMVWRCEGKSVPPDLIHNCLEVWQELAPDIEHRLYEVQKSAINTLQRMVTCLSIDSLI